MIEMDIEKIMSEFSPEWHYWTKDIRKILEKHLKEDKAECATVQETANRRYWKSEPTKPKIEPMKFIENWTTDYIYYDKINEIVAFINKN